MPAIGKTPFSSKNPATITKGFTGGVLNSPGAVGEVICPLTNSDGSQCRKKCVGNFAYRSICEHIRRAHPDNWIPKLPASPETFAKMVGLMPRNNMENGMVSHVSIAPSPRKHANITRKPAKLPKPYEDRFYLDGISPPPSANESETSLPSISPTGIVAQNYSNHLPHYAPPKEEVDRDHEVEDEMESEDDDFNHIYSHHAHYSTLSHLQHYPPSIGHHNMSNVSPKARVSKLKPQKRKRHSTLDSTTSSVSSSSSYPSRWDELIEAATTRAVVETSLPLSPPQTAQTLPSICPNTPSGQSVASSNDSNTAKIECNECRSLVGVKSAFVCTECVAGFCEPCATENGKRGVCSECRVFGARWRRLNIVIRI
jgi:hypothetical protein